MVFLINPNPLDYLRKKLIWQTRLMRYIVLKIKKMNEIHGEAVSMIRTHQVCGHYKIPMKRPKAYNEITIFNVSSKSSTFRLGIFLCEGVRSLGE